jgi:hypothetical protein
MVKIVAEVFTEYKDLLQFYFFWWYLSGMTRKKTNKGEHFKNKMHAPQTMKEKYC